ncbi:MAG: hypothetical protein KME04_08940 [Pleurocapsa minor GSE-CHR-MK-17-07R]|jgi:hypothetical protein|nr:hypothetical protein [Pleurocapsa minor GSE-CHR-MK 17-07R]
MVAAALMVSAAAAQDAGFTPAVDVSSQVVFNGTVTIDRVVSNGPGFIVIHVNNNGGPGPVIGYSAVNTGENLNVAVDVDTAGITSTMFAMLHTDDGMVGAYEFDGASGLDNPVSVDGAVITPAFDVSAMAVSDQFLAGDTVTIDSVTVSAPSWVVIHNDNGGSPGPVLGQTLVPAGTTANVVVTLAAEGRTGSLWPMLHVDDGTAGTYEFDGASGLDNPIIAGGRVATSQLWTVPHVRMGDQIVLNGDNSMVMSDRMALMVTAESVLCAAECVLVMHTDNGGSPGPVLGATVLPAGLSRDVIVTFSMPDIAATPVMWPMLHVDDGQVGVYEFDGASGLDNPVTVDGAVLTFPINIAPSMDYEGQAAADGVIRIDSALIDAAGWLVIHQSADGQPGPVLGQVPLRAGLNSGIEVTVDAELAGTEVFPMLHYDTNAAGVYEFGTVEGADAPVFFGGNVVVSPLGIAQ